MNYSVDEKQTSGEGALVALEKCVVETQAHLEKLTVEAYEKKVFLLGKKPSPGKLESSGSDEGDYKGTSNCSKPLISDLHRRLEEMDAMIESIQKFIRLI